ncbi:Bridging integrator 3-like protein [Leptotrombidium deliense]|uniref:Bridging integrator 3-like protein n=1 Tax=Leptotrombidium deliense TaxID=299467 RepID=A0A443SPQ5_9ACAR|nr:Bridging integrator 3-like protein [Leptotrombidium deliense]
MAWNPLRILSSKSGPNAGCGISTVDEEDVDKITTRLNNVETTAKKIHKSGKKLNETLLNFNRQECKLSSDLSDSVLCQQYSPELRALVEDWHTFNTHCSQFGEDYAVCVQKVLVDALKRFEGALNEAKNCLRKREQLRNDCIKFSARVSKLSEKEKTGQNVAKLQQMKDNLSQAEDELRQQSALILQEIPAFIDYRINYFQPSLEGFIKAQTYFWGESSKSYNSYSLLSSQIKPPTKSSWNEYKQNQQKLLNQISSLSIVDGSD